MKKTHAFAGLVLSMALFGAGLTNAFAADETLRSLADKNGIYIGAILNSQWFGGGLPGNYEQIQLRTDSQATVQHRRCRKRDEV